jgi:hypothetical protein
MMGEIDRMLEGEWLLSQNKGIIPQIINEHTLQSPLFKNVTIVCYFDNGILMVKINSYLGVNELIASSIKETSSGIKFLILVPKNSQDSNTEHSHNLNSCIIPYRFDNDDIVHVLDYDLEKIIKDYGLPYKKAPPPSNISPFSSMYLGDLTRDDLRKWAEALSKNTTPMYVFNRHKIAGSHDSQSVEKGHTQVKSRKAMEAKE